MSVVTSVLSSRMPQFSNQGKNAESESNSLPSAKNLMKYIHELLAVFVITAS